MTSIQVLYLLGAVPALIFPVYYTLTARWWGNREGRLFFAMGLPGFLLYASIAIFLVIPVSEFRDILRFAFVLVASCTSWAMLLVYRQIRRDEMQRVKDEARRSSQQ